MQPGLDEGYRPEDEAEQNDVEAEALKQYEAESVRLRNPIIEDADE